MSYVPIVDSSKHQFNTIWQPIDTKFMNTVIKHEQKYCDYIIGKSKKCKNKSKITLMVTTGISNIKHYETYHLCKKHFNKMVKLKK